jgi:hypothetical protein
MMSSWQTQNSDASRREKVDPYLELEFVIASEAKQSIFTSLAEGWIASSLRSSQ